MNKRFYGIICLLLSVMLLFTACGSFTDSYSSNESKSQASSDSYHEGDGLSDVEEAADAATPDEQPKSAGGDRKIIVNAKYTLETQDLDKSVAQLEKAVAAVGGYYESSEVEGNTESGGTAEYVVRIPADKLDDFTGGIGKWAFVVSQSRSGEDVTDAYFDIETRLSSLRVQQERLMALLEKAETLDEILQLERELTDVRIDIESLTTRLKKYDDLVDYSTVTIYLRQVEEYSEPVDQTAGEQMAGVLQSSLSLAGSVLWTMLLVLIFLLPYLIFAAVVLVIILVIVKARKKRRNKQQ